MYFLFWFVRNLWIRERKEAWQDSLRQFGSHARVVTRGALRDDATNRQIRDEIGSKLFAQTIECDLCGRVVYFLFCFFLLANDFSFLCCDISHQGDIQGTYDAIDKESFTQTDRQVRSNKNSLQGPSLLRYFTVTTRATRRIGRGGKNDSELFAPVLILLSPQ